MNSFVYCDDEPLTDNAFAILAMTASFLLFVLFFPFVWLGFKIGGRRCGN